MNRKVIEEWIAALESGEYAQGTHELRPTKDTYCCLGVLCDLHAKSQGGKWTEPIVDEEDGSRTSYEYGGREDYLPKVVQEWAGIDDAGFDGLSVVELNDDGCTFQDIAKEIRKYLNDNGS